METEAKFSREAHRQITSPSPASDPQPVNMWHRLTEVTSQIVFDAEGDRSEEERERYLASQQKSNEVHPRGRSSHSLSAAHLADGRKVLILLGGEDFPRHAFETCLWIWELDKKDATWKQLETSGDAPCARLGHVAAVVGDDLWIFGGRTNEKQDLNDLYSCNLSTGIWKKHQATGDVPKDRSYHSADAAGGHVFVWSGCTTVDGEFTRLNDLHRLDLANL